MTGGDENLPLDFNLDLTGRTLEDRWRVEGVLGKGGMGTVYKATDLRLDRTVVLKVPHPRFLAEEGFRERFEREIRSLIVLEHPHVVKVHDVGAWRGVPYAVLQFLSGGSLKDRLDAVARRESPAEVLEWFPDVASALDFIHARGVVHRDVKPGNILFDETGHAFLADFGIAKALGGLETGLTQTGMTPGSPDYMAPEIVMSRPFGPEGDQYALASMVYESLAGRLPFPGATPLEVLVAKQTAPDPVLSVDDVPVPAADAVLRALARDPAKRFPTCGQFAAAFAEAMGVSLGSRRASGVRAGGGGGPVTPTPRPAPRPPPLSPPPPPRPPPPPPPSARQPGAPRPPAARPAPAPSVAAATEPAKRRGGLVAALLVVALLAGGYAAWSGGLFGGRAKDGDRDAAKGTSDGIAGREVHAGMDVTAGMDLHVGMPEIDLGPAMDMGEVKNAADLEAIKRAATEAAGKAATDAGSAVAEGLRGHLGKADFPSKAPTVVPDDAVPVIAIESPVEGVVVARRRMHVVGTVSPAGSKVVVNGAAADVKDGKFDVRVDVSEGEGRLLVEATTAAGRTSTASRAFRVDTTPPSLRIESPPSDFATSAHEARVAGTVDEDGCVVTVRSIPATVSDRRGFATTVPLPLEGENRVSITASDPAGNASRVEVVVVRDTIAPVLVVEAPKEGARAGASALVPVRGKVTDATATKVTVNGVTAKVENGRFSLTAPFDPRSPRVVVEATDAAGNASEKLVVTLKGRPTEGTFKGLTLVESDGRGPATYTLDKDSTVVLVLVPAGEFTMGAVRGDEAAASDEGVAHRTTLAQFLVSRAEVTWAQWGRFCDATNRKRPAMPDGAGPDHPATCTHDDAIAWCEWAGLRLPSEAEWERAARGGVEGQLFAWGSDLQPPKGAANLYDETRHRKTKSDAKAYWFGYDDGYVGTAPVGSFAANGFGLVDVTGNVWEWCAEVYDRSKAIKHVLRGGGFDSKPADCRLSARNSQIQGFVNAATGFRPSRDAR